MKQNLKARHCKLSQQTGPGRTAIFFTTGYSLLFLFLMVLLYHEETTVDTKAPPSRPPLWPISRWELTMIILAGLVWAQPNAGFIVLMSFMPVYLVSDGMEMARAGMLVSIASVITIGTVPPGGWLTDRTGKINVFIIGGVLLNTLFIFLVPFGAPVLLCVLLLGLTMGGWPGAIMSLPNQLLSLRSRSTGFGVFYMVYYLRLPDLA